MKGINMVFNFWNTVADAMYVISIYFFYESFLAPKKTAVYRKYMFLAAYWVGITLVQVVFNLAWVTMIAQIIFQFLLTFFYDSGLGRRILALVFIMAYLLSLETIGMIVLYGVESYTISGHALSGTSPTAPAPISIAIVALITTFLYRKIKQHKVEAKVPFTYWVAVIVIPLACIFIIFLIYSISGIKTWKLLSVVFTMLAVTISVFLLYEKQMRFYLAENKKKVLELQNDYYKKQLEYVQATERATKNLRHDMKNHLLSITALAREKDNPEIVDYIGKVYNYSQLGRKHISTGNVVIDSIVNYKWMLAEEKEIDMTVDIAIPKEINMDDIDVTILFGNLLDNAIENAAGTTERKVALSIRYDKGRMFVSCVNSYNGKTKRDGNEYHTVKPDREKHGFGLKSMKEVIGKYDGDMNIQDENHEFRVEIFLYIEVPC